MKHYLFTPIYQERVWGGDNRTTKLGRTLPDDLRIGESWDIVDRPEAQSKTHDGTTIRSLIELNPESIMGKGWDPKQPFPILVKWLDCQSRLSLQVHPPEEMTKELGGETKSENWYFAETESDAIVMAGLKENVSKEEFIQSQLETNLEPLIHKIKPVTGDSIYIPSGRVHAIGGGNLILEIQQNSDTTFRVYDWGRLGLDGKPRPLHTEQSLKCIDFEDYAPEVVKPEGKSQTLVDSPEFKLSRISLKRGEAINYGSGKPKIISVVSGGFEENEDRAKLNKGDSALLPAAESFKYEALMDSVILVTEDFT